MIHSIPQFILFIWLSTPGPVNHETLATATFYDLGQCQYAAQLALKRQTVNVAYCVAVQEQKK